MDTRRRSVPLPTHIAHPKTTLRFRILRDGQATPERKYIRLFLSWSTINFPIVALYTEYGTEYTRAISLDIASFVAQGDFLVTGEDVTPPKRTRASYLSLPASGGTITFNISSGDGDSQQGDPAVVNARVRVERADASREVVVLERPADGQWRVAGYGPTPDGEGVIDLRVVGGDVYALSVDDYGVAFVADLAVQVGQRVRPTVYAGWVYEITEAGTLPSVEPVWWAAVGDNASRPLGTARAVAHRYFQPIAVGPGPVEVL